MDYLRTREQKLRDTNESTNERVKYFAYLTMITLVALGTWQVIYLRAYFRCVLLPVLKYSHANYESGRSILSKAFSSIPPPTVLVYLAARNGHGDGGVGAESI